MSKSMQSALLILFIILAGIVGIKYFVKKSERKKTNNVKIYENPPEKEEINTADFENGEEKAKDISRFDINNATIEEMRGMGLTAGTAQNIIAFREKYGCIRTFEDIDNIKGVGAKTLEKIKEKFYIDAEKIKSIPYVKININEENNRDVLLVLGFTKKECDLIDKWKQSNGSIFSNVDLLKIIGDKRYGEMNDKIKYSN